MSNEFRAEVLDDKIDAQESVKDKDLTAPPGSPSDGDRYIIASGATAGWSGHDKKIAHYNGSAWIFITPDEGTFCWVEDENSFYHYPGTFSGAVWTKGLGTGGSVDPGLLVPKLFEPHLTDWLTDAAAGSVGGEWNFLVDGMTTPSGWAFSHSAGLTIHTAKIQASGRPFIDWSTDATYKGAVYLLKPVTGLRPPTFWPLTQLSVDATVSLVSGARANGEFYIEYLDLNDPASGGTDLMRAGWRGVGINDFYYGRRLNEITYTNQFSGIQNIIGVRNITTLSVSRAKSAVYQTYGVSTGKQRVRVDLDDGGRYWYRGSFSDTDPLRILIADSNSFSVGRCSMEVFGLSALLYEVP